MRRQQPATLVFEFQDAAGLRARKEFRFDPRNYVVAFSATCREGRRDAQPDDRRGVRASATSARRRRRQLLHRQLRPAAAGDLSPRRRRRAARCRQTSTTQPAHEGQFRFAGIDDHYFIAAAVNPGQARLEFRPLTLPGAGRRPSASCWRSHSASRSRRQRRALLRRPEAVRPAASPSMRSWSARSTSASSRCSRAAAQRAEVDSTASSATTAGRSSC